MNNILVSSFNKKSLDNIINSKPDIILSNPECPAESDALKSLSYKGIQGILYNPDRFTEFKIDQSVAPIVDLNDATTHKIIRIAAPKLEVDRAALFEKMEGADVQILAGKDALNAFFIARGYTQEPHSAILVKGAKSISHVLNDQDPIANLEVEASHKTPKTWFQTIVSIVKDFFRMISFKLLAKLILRAVF